MTEIPEGKDFDMNEGVDSGKGSLGGAVFGVQLSPKDAQVIKQSIVKPVSAILSGIAAATATNYGNFFVADRPYVVVGIAEVHLTAGTDGGAVTVSVEKCSTGVAPGSGKDLLSTALSLKTTTNTPQFGTLTNTKVDLLIKKGDRLVLKDAGVLTAVADVCVTVTLKER